MTQPAQAIDLMKAAAERQRIQRETAKQSALDIAAEMEAERVKAARGEQGQP